MYIFAHEAWIQNKMQLANPSNFQNPTKPLSTYLLYFNIKHIHSGINSFQLQNIFPKKSSEISLKLICDLWLPKCSITRYDYSSNTNPIACNIIYSLTLCISKIKQSKKRNHACESLLFPLPPLFLVKSIKWKCSMTTLATATAIASSTVPFVAGNIQVKDWII